MEGNPSVRSTPQLVLALLVIILGILFTLDNLDIRPGFALVWTGGFSRRSFPPKLGPGRIV